MGTEAGRRAMKTTIGAWLAVRGSKRAVEFYNAAFGAVEVFKIEAPDESVVARLSVEGAEFWVGDESPEHKNFSPETLGGGTVRMVLTVNDPDAMFARAVKAGAAGGIKFGEEDGWRVGRVVGPYGHPLEVARVTRGEQAV